jgi:hypothetical protein
MTQSVGRPSKLTDEVIAKAKEYVDGGYLVDELVPTVAGLAVYIDIRKSTLYEWAKENSQFSDFLSTVMTKQEKGLLKGGMTGDYNSTITKLMLTKHGYSDKQETEITGANGGPAVILERVFVDPAKDNN